MRNKTPLRDMKAGRLIAFVSITALIFFVLPERKAMAENYVRKSGSIVASLDGEYIRIGGGIAGEFDGKYVRKSGSIVGSIDDSYIRANGSIIGQIDGDYLRKNGSIAYTFDSNGYVRKNGGIYLQVDGYDGSAEMKKMIAAYLFFFDK